MEDKRTFTGIASFDSGRGNTIHIKFPEVTPNEVQIFENDCLLNTKDEDTERFTLITSEPEMPVISIINYLDECIRGRLKIEYTKNSGGNIVRKWLNYYPAENDDEVETETINVGSSLTIDFGNDIRGGKATYEYVIGDNEWNEDNIQTFIFYIRGENPNREEVLEYIQDKGYDDDYWFLIRLIRHESGTGNANIFRHFIIGTNYTTTSVRGLPNLGFPRGFGLGQIDNFRRLTQTERNNLNLNELEAGETIVDNQDRTIDWQGYIVASDNQVWNWKENIDTVIDFLNRKKGTIINSYNNWIQQANQWDEIHPNDLIVQHSEQIEGNITFKSIESYIEGIPNTINEYFEEWDDLPTTKSFIDACLIRYYNGGYYHRLRRNGNEKPYWDIDRESTQSGFYVEHICNQNE